MGGELDLSSIPVATQLVNTLFYSEVTSEVHVFKLFKVCIPSLWSSVLSVGKFIVMLRGSNIFKYWQYS